MDPGGKQTQKVRHTWYILEPREFRHWFSRSTAHWFGDKRWFKKGRCVVSGSSFSLLSVVSDSGLSWLPNNGNFHGWMPGSPKNPTNMAVDRDISSPHCSSFHPFRTLPNLSNLQEVYLCTYYDTVTMYFRRLVVLATLALGALGAPQPPGNSDLTKRQCVDKWPIEQCAPYVQDCFDPSIGLRLRQNCAKTCGVCKLGCQSLLLVTRADFVMT